jgi:hypothetical protein
MQERIMSETIVTPYPPEDQPPSSFLGRAVGMFISPGQAFESIVRRPNFLAPLIVAVVMAIAVTETMLHKIGMERIVLRSIELSSRASQMSPDQLQQAAHQGATIGAIFARVIELVGVPIYLLLVAAVGLFIVNVMFGGKTHFKVDFSVACYAFLVSLVGSVLALVLILFGDPEQFNPSNFIPSNPGFFLNPRETSKFLYTIASSFDIFTIWFLILAAMGLSIASARKVRTTPIFLTFMGLWLVWVLAKAGLSMIGG